jgi:hypothetical protein
MEAARLDAPFDFPTAEAEVEQLLPRQNVMLPPSQPPSSTRSLLLSSLAWWLVNLPPHTVDKSPTAFDSPPTQPVFKALSG